MSGPVAVSGGDTEEETVVLLESRGVCEHLVLGSHGLRSTLDLVDGDVTTSLSDTSGLLLDQLRDVAVRRELHACQSIELNWKGPSSSFKKYKRP